MSEFICGRHAVLEALRMKLPVKKVYLSPRLKDFSKLSETIHRTAPHVEMDFISRKKIENLSGYSHTGGIGAVLEEIKMVKSAETLLTVIQKKDENPLLVVLDEISDPHNFGAIIRSACGAGFHGVVFQKKRQAGVTGTVAAASAGACFMMPLCEVVNITRTLNFLKKRGFWIYGAESGKHTSLYDVAVQPPLAVVIGAEGKGMRQQVRSTCDELVSIPINTNLNSLNASVAAGIVMFEIVRRLSHKTRPPSPPEIS